MKTLSPAVVWHQDNINTNVRSGYFFLHSQSVWHVNGTTCVSRSSQSPLKAAASASWYELCTVTSWELCTCTVNINECLTLSSASILYYNCTTINLCYFIMQSTSTAHRCLVATLCCILSLFFMWWSLLVIKHFIIPSNHWRHCPVFSLSRHFTQFPSSDFHASVSLATLMVWAAAGIKTSVNDLIMVFICWGEKKWRIARVFSTGEGKLAAFQVEFMNEATIISNRLNFD